MLGSASAPPTHRQSEAPGKGERETSIEMGMNIPFDLRPNAKSDCTHTRGLLLKMTKKFGGGGGGGRDGFNVAQREEEESYSLRREDPVTAFGAAEAGSKSSLPRAGGGERGETAAGADRRGTRQQKR